MKKDHQLNKMGRHNIERKRRRFRIRHSGKQGSSAHVNPMEAVMRMLRG